jgi:hypothetical protein
MSRRLAAIRWPLQGYIRPLILAVAAPPSFMLAPLRAPPRVAFGAKLGARGLFRGEKGQTRYGKHSQVAAKFVTFSAVADIHAGFQP